MDTIKPSNRALRPDERMLTPSEVDRVYRLSDGTAINDHRAGKLPGVPRKPRRGRMSCLVHPDDALALYAGDR